MAASPLGEPRPPALGWGHHPAHGARAPAAGAGRPLPHPRTRCGVVTPRTGRGIAVALLTKQGIIGRGAGGGRGRGGRGRRQPAGGCAGGRSGGEGGAEAGAGAGAGGRCWGMREGAEGRGRRDAAPAPAQPRAAPARGPANHGPGSQSQARDLDLASELPCKPRRHQASRLSQLVRAFIKRIVQSPKWLHGPLAVIFLACHMWLCPARSLILQRPLWHLEPVEISLLAAATSIWRHLQCLHVALAPS